MTDTPATDSDAATKPAGTDATAIAPTAPTGRPRRLIAAVVIGVLAVAGIIGAIAVVADDDSPDHSASQIGWMHEGCQQWAGGYRGADGPDDAWCGSMAGWMDGRMGDSSMRGQGQMMGSMMWQSPTNLRTTCQQWMAANPDVAPEGADASAWCAQMVDWMDQHMGGWDDGMMNRPFSGN